MLLSGRGERLYKTIGVKKQFYFLGGKHIYLYPLESAIKCQLFEKVILVVDHEDEEKVNEEVTALYQGFDIEVITGGESRNESVYNALRKLAAANPDKVIIHDAARPFLDIKTLQEVVIASDASQAVTCYTKVYDSLFDIESEQYLDRKNKALIYTPQAFDYKLIKSAYDEGYREDSTDDFSKVLDKKVTHKYVLAPSYLFKVTDEKSLELATLIMKEN